MRTDKYKNAILTVEDGKKALLYGRSIDGAIIDDNDEVVKYVRHCEHVLGRETKILPVPIINISFDEYHKERTRHWDIPDNYKNIDVQKYLIDKCLTEDEEQRVVMEYKMFAERGLIPLLQFLIYLVDYMREHKILWGAGRGSSVASYCLYLIGVHKVNSLRYELPIEEFLK